jgi:hypothetical protein
MNIFKYRRIEITTKGTSLHLPLIYVRVHAELWWVNLKARRHLEGLVLRVSIVTITSELTFLLLHSIFLNKCSNIPYDFAREWRKKELEPHVEQSWWGAQVEFPMINSNKRNCMKITHTPLLYIGVNFTTGQNTTTIFDVSKCTVYGVRGGAVGWGTELQSRKVAFSIPGGVTGIYIILPAALWPWSRLSLQ